MEHISVQRTNAFKHEPRTYNGCGCFLSVQVDTMAAWLYSGDQLLTTTGREVNALLEMAADLTHGR